jgi:hypothetical protein
MSSLPCPNRSPTSLSKTNEPFTAFSSGLPPKRSRPLLPILNISAPQSVSLPFFTPGVRICFTIPILHCVIPGGGLSPGGDRWISCRPGFFLPVRVLSRLFRRLFLEYLEAAFDSGKLQFFGSIEKLRDAHEFRLYLAPLKQTEWVVYAKPPFAGPQKVIDYVGRYTHRVAISNNRLLDMEQDRVTFHWKDYRHNDRQKTMTLSAEEFIRRFLIHVLPEGFQRIRYYGFLSNRYRAEKLALCRQLLGMPIVDPETNPGAQPVDYDYQTLYEKLTASLRQCPICRQGRMVVVETLAPTIPVLIDSS